MIPRTSNVTRPVDVPAAPKKENIFSDTESIIKYQNTRDDSSGRKDDTGKARYDLLAPEFERDVAAVLTIGAEKYGANNWKDVDNAEDRYYAALRRHIAAWRMGEKVDPESKQSHLAHAACNLMFLMHFDNVSEESNG